MTQEEKALQHREKKRSSLPAVREEEEIIDGDLIKLQLQYFGSTALPLTLILEIMGAQLGGIALAIGAGVGVAYFAKDIHYAIEPALKMGGKVLGLLGSTKAGGRTAYRLTNKDWWLGQDITPFAPEMDDDEDDDGEEEEEISKTFLNIGPTLRPHVNALFGSRTGIFGIPGSGKSNTVAVLLEELGEYECPLLVLDTENENSQLCSPEYFCNSNRESAKSITPANAYAWGKAIMENNLQVVLNLQSYKTDDDAAEVMIALVQGINDWEEEQSVRVPCAIVLDEAHKWLPQQAGMSSLNKEKDDTGFTLLQKLQQCFLGTLASRGRKRGMGLIFATQRLAMLDKNLIMCEWLFLLRQTLPTDLKTYREMGCAPEVAQKLESGQAYVITPTKEHQTHQIRLRFSESGAKTPGLAELEEYKRSRSQKAFTPPVSQAENVGLNTTIRERVNEPVEPVNASEDTVNIPNGFTPTVKAENAKTKVTAEVKETILKTIIAMQMEGVKVNRTALRDRLEWNSRQYEEVLKPALDELGLLK